MPGFTRRGVLKSGAAFAGGGMLTALSPDFVRGVSDLLILGQARPDLTGARLIAKFAAGSGPQELGIQNFALMEPQGPSAIAARGDGSLAILDTVNRRIATVRDGRIHSTISLPGVVYASDLQEAGGKLFVLDSAGNQVFEVSDSVRRSQSLPTAAVGRASGLVDTGDGDVAVVEEDQASYRLASGRAGLAPGFAAARGQVINVEYGHPTFARHRADVYIGSTRVPVVTRSFLGSVTVAGTDAAGRTYLLSSELIAGQTGNEVDLVVRRVERSGSVSALARVPVRNRWFNPARAVTIAPSGQAFAIFPQRDGTLLLELIWEAQLNALAAPFMLDAPKFEAAAAQLIPTCRQTANNTANNYYSHAWYCQQSNYNTCTQYICNPPPNQNQCAWYTSQRPAYITGLGWYGWLPYNWGGWVTVSGFDADIAAGKTAGNTSPAKVMSCPTGVDCSGFIQRCWNINDYKRDDSGLTLFCTNNVILDPNNPPPWMNRSDMYRLQGAHVRMHDQYASGMTGVFTFEAPGNPGRILWTYYSWAQLNGYQWNIGNFNC
jgi:hypothetical protein